jgi:hypothetical protein
MALNAICMGPSRSRIYLGRVEIGRNRLRSRLRVRLRRHRLDRELAYGGQLRPCDDRRARAEQLADAPTRRQLARSLRQLVAELDRPPMAGLRSAVPLRRDALMPWREGLLGLAERLERRVPLNPRGVARLQILLTDGIGPFYNSCADRTVGEAIWWVSDGLALCPPHTWGCPVIMKLDPEHVAWTCQACGSVATTEDVKVRPK